jgi:hypothetical protein
MPIVQIGETSHRVAFDHAVTQGFAASSLDDLCPGNVTVWRGVSGPLWTTNFEVAPHVYHMLTTQQIGELYRASERGDDLRQDDCHVRGDPLKWQPRELPEFTTASPVASSNESVASDASTTLASMDVSGRCVSPSLRKNAVNPAKPAKPANPTNSIKTSKQTKSNSSDDSSDESDDESDSDDSSVAGSVSSEEESMIGSGSNTSSSDSDDESGDDRSVCAHSVASEASAVDDNSEDEEEGDDHRPVARKRAVGKPPANTANKRRRCTEPVAQTLLSMLPPAEAQPPILLQENAPLAMTTASAAVAMAKAACATAVAPVPQRASPARPPVAAVAAAPVVASAQVVAAKPVAAKPAVAVAELDSDDISEMSGVVPFTLQKLREELDAFEASGRKHDVIRVLHVSTTALLAFRAIRSVT